MNYKDTLEYKLKELNKLLYIIFNDICKILKIQLIVNWLNKKIT